MSDTPKMSAEALAKIKNRHDHFQRGKDLNTNTEIWWAIDDRASLLRCVTALEAENERLKKSVDGWMDAAAKVGNANITLEAELARIRERCTVDDIAQVIKLEWLDGVTDDDKGRKQTARAIIAHVTEGEK